MGRKPATDPSGLALRLVAAARLRAVLGGEAFAPFKPAEIADPRDRALANRLVTTALRRHGQIDFVLAELLERGMPAKAGSFEAILRLSLAQLLYLPELGAHSALFLAVEAVRREPRARHLAGLINAVLRRAQAGLDRYRALPTSLLLPGERARRWASAYGEAALDAFAKTLIAGAPLDLTLRDPDPGLVESLGAVPLVADSVRVTRRDRPVKALPGYAEGRWWVQDAASAIPARLMGLLKGARVLDLCAAPGGKTAQLVKAGHDVTALDADPARMERLAANLERLGYGAQTVVADGTDYVPSAPFEGVLLDAPCSASGTFRRHPEVLWTRPGGGLSGRIALQRALIVNAARCLKPGGTLVYCVCSLEPEEGEDQIAWALGALPGLEPWPVGPDEMPGLEGALTREGFLRTHPGMDPGGVEGGMDGFFVGRLRAKV